MDNYALDIVSSETDNRDEVMLIINDNYANMDICNYILPVAETANLNYILTKEESVEPEIYTINYMA